MIEFRGTTEESWMNMQGDKIKFMFSKLNDYKKEHKNSFKCPFTGSK